MSKDAIVTWDQLESLTFDEAEAYRWQDFKLAEINATSSLQSDAVIVRIADVEIDGTTSIEIIGVKVVRGTVTIETQTVIEVDVYAFERDIQRSMNDYLPKYYEESYEAQAIINTEADELRVYNAEITATLEQMFVNTATYGLSKWEEIYDIYTDVNKTIQQRRAAIKAKQRASGTLTKEKLREIAEPFYAIEIEEDFANYGLTIHCVANEQIPTELDEFKTVMREAIPAHIALTIKFAKMRWNELEETYITFDALSLETWNDVESNVG